MFCAKCGKEFIASNGNVKYCKECRPQVKIEQREKQRKYTRDRLRKLNLTSINIYKDDSKYLTALAKEKGINVANLVKEMLLNYESLGRM